jgi:hypothetical protein
MLCQSAATRNAAASGYERIRLNQRIEVVPHSEESSAGALRLFNDRSAKTGGSRTAFPLQSCGGGMFTRRSRQIAISGRPVFAPYFQKRRQERRSTSPSSNGNLERPHR